MGKDRSRRQVANYNILRNKWAISAMVLFVLDMLCVLLLGIIPLACVLALMAALSIGAFACALAIRDTSKEELLAVVDDPDPVSAKDIKAGLRGDALLLDSHGKEAEDEVNGNDCYVMSDDLNHAFVRFPIRAAFSDDDWTLPESVLPYAGVLKDVRNSEMPKFAALRPDKSVCGLASDLPPSMIMGEDPHVIVNDLTRYTVQVTDDAFNKIIINKKKVSDKVVFCGRALALDENGALVPFSASQIANEIDIHSLIISKDGYLMIAKGTTEHPLHAGEVISSASCSLLPSEIDGRPIQESMIDSIHAKLHALFLIPQGVEMRSSFCGTSRMIRRGGAPEFYCITRVGMTRDQLIAAHKDPTTTFLAAEDVFEIEIGNADTARDLVMDAVRAVRQSTDEEGKQSLSLSASAMFSAIISAMEDVRTAGKVLRRVGVIADENDIR